MPKFNFKVNIKDIEGNLIKDEDGKILLLNEVLANSISRKSEGDALKLFGWAKRLYTEGDLDLDISDTQLFKTTVQSLQLFIFIKGQILEIIAKAEG